MSRDKDVSYYEDTSNTLKALFSAAEIPLDDDGIIQILAGVYDFMNQNHEVWVLFKDFRLGIDVYSYNLSDSGAQADACYEVGLKFKETMEKFCLSTKPLDTDHFTFIGIFTIVLGTYPKAYEIVEQLLDGVLIPQPSENHTPTSIH
jgi:hypothetical protein